jgi:hypothetical protein
MVPHELAWRQALGSARLLKGMGVLLILGDQKVRYESLSFGVGQTLWSVITVVPDTPDAGETLERILGSVRLVEARF